VVFWLCCEGGLKGEVQCLEIRGGVEGLMIL
jgi:hypothetical protein